MSTSSGRKRSLRVPSPQRRSFCSSLYARSLRCELLEDRRLLAQLTVTTDQDVIDFNDGETSLREAIFAANIVPGADEIVFDFGHDGPATILLTQGELKIEDSLTITGPGAELLTIDAQQQSRIFNISATTGDFASSGMTLTKGSTSGEDAAFSGGAIHSTSTGLLTLDGVHFVGNRTLGLDARGGAVYASATLDIQDSLFLENSTAGNNATGGAVHAVGAHHHRDKHLYRQPDRRKQCEWRGGVLLSSVTADGAGFTINRTMGNGSAGGAINAASLVMSNSTVSGNSTLGATAFGGAINVGGLLGGRTPSAIADSFIIDNYTIGMNSPGGGVSARGTITIERSTISGNFTVSDNSGGGGLYALCWHPQRQRVRR